MDFDQILAEAAIAAGATLRTSTNVSGPITDGSGRVIGVTATVGPDKEPIEYRAPIVIAADGVSARFALAMGIVEA